MRASLSGTTAGAGSAGASTVLESTGGTEASCAEAISNQPANTTAAKTHVCEFTLLMGRSGPGQGYRNRGGTRKSAIPSFVRAAQDSAERAQCVVRVAVGSAARADFPAQALQRHTLDDDVPRTGQHGQKHSLSAEQRGLDAAHELDVVIDCIVEGHDAAGIHVEHLPLLQVEIDEVAAGMDEHRAGPGELFQDESFAAEEAGA